MKKETSDATAAIEGNLAEVPPIGYDGNSYFCAKCKTAGEVCIHFLKNFPQCFLNFPQNFPQKIPQIVLCRCYVNVA
jgi:hypothetical protein